MTSNKSGLDISKTEVALFKSSRKLNTEKLTVNRKRLYPTSAVKYLDIKTDENLNWKQQISNTALMLNKENYILSKLRDLIGKKNYEINISCIFWTLFVLLLTCLDSKLKFSWEIFCFGKKNLMDCIFLKS